MAVADHARHLPAIADLFPNHHEWKIAAIIPALFLVAKSMGAQLNGAEVFDRVDLKRAWQQRALDVRRITEHLGEALTGLLVVTQAVLIVVKFYVVGKHRHQHVHIVGVESVESPLVHSRYGLGEIGRFGRASDVRLSSSGMNP